MAAVEIGVGDLIDNGFHHGRNGFHLIHSGVIGDTQCVDHAPIAHVGEIENRGIGEG